MSSNMPGKSPISVCVAEDEEYAINALSIILRRAGFSVTTASNGHSALDSIVALSDSSSPIDLLICDIEMPGMNGLEVIDELHRFKIDIPILVMTGYTDRDTLDRLHRRGCRHYICKPFDRNQLIAKVDELLESCGMRQSAEAKTA